MKFTHEQVLRRLELELRQKGIELSREQIESMRQTLVDIDAGADKAIADRLRQESFPWPEWVGAAPVSTLPSDFL
jgi:hypothetical protein